MPLVLGCDIDGPLLADRVFDFFRYAMDRGYAWDYAALVATGRWDEAAPGCANRTIDSLFADFCRDGNGYSDPEITPGSAEALQTIVKRDNGGGQVLTITTRPEFMKAETVGVLEAFFPVFYGHFFGFKERKFEVVVQEGVQAFVDDSICEVNLVAREGSVKTILFPVRGRGRPSNLHRGAITLGVEAYNCSDIDDGGWERVCAEAWQEITKIVASI